MSKSQIVEIPLKEFKKLIARVDYYKDQVKDLKDVIRFQNEQITKYNSQFGKGDT